MLKKLAAVILFAALAVIAYKLYTTPATDALTIPIVAMLAAACLVLEIDLIRARPKDERLRAVRKSVVELGSFVAVFWAVSLLPYPWELVFALGVIGFLVVRASFGKRAAVRATAGPDVSTPA